MALHKLHSLFIPGVTIVFIFICNYGFIFSRDHMALPHIFMAVFRLCTCGIANSKTSSC